MYHKWRNHPSLHDKFHPDYPDDLQVLVHDGGRRITTVPPKVVWVRVINCDGNIFRGQILNQPSQLKTVKQGSMIDFIVPDGGEYPIKVTAKYLSERNDWIINPCNKCGLTELFDAPSELIKLAFPHTPNNTEMEVFTSFCPLCDGMLLVQHKDAIIGKS